MARCPRANRPARGWSTGFKCGNDGVDQRPYPDDHAGGADIVPGQGRVIVTGPGVEIEQVVLTRISHFRPNASRVIAVRPLEGSP